MQQFQIPGNMREVTKEEFFATIGPLDVTPSVNSPDFTTWEDRSRKVHGWSAPGWRNSGNPNATKVWALPR